MNKMNLDYYLQKFLNVELRKNINVSENTIISYKYAFISLLEFIIKNYSLEGVQVQPVTFNRTENGTLIYQLIDKETQETVAEGTVDTTGWEDAKFTEITFQRVEESKGREYVLRIQADNTPADQGVSFYTTQKQEGTSLSLNGEDRDECLVLKTVYKTFNLQEFLVFAGMMAYILLFIKLLYKFIR